MGSSWAADEDERERFVALARQLQGLCVNRVRYFDIDYRRDDFAPGHTGPREITDEREWAEPTYEFPGGHTLDYGLEVGNGAGDSWSLVWVPPGWTEGLALHHEAMFPEVLSADGSIAVWDVSARSPWRRLLGRPVERVDVHYEPWDEATGSWWCRRIDFIIAGTTIEVLEAEGRPDGTIEPSADNLVLRVSEGP